jgi:hypothetical protein
MCAGVPQELAASIVVVNESNKKKADMTNVHLENLENFRLKWSSAKVSIRSRHLQLEAGLLVPW